MGNQNTDCPPLLSVIATVQRVVHLELMLCQGLQANSSWLAGQRDAQTQTQLLSLSPLSQTYSLSGPCESVMSSSGGPS